jgi:hypothetical protein
MAPAAPPPILLLAGAAKASPKDPKSRYNNWLIAKLVSIFLIWRREKRKRRELESHAINKVGTKP